MIVQFVDTVHGCIGVVPVDDAEVPPHVQVQTPPAQLVEIFQDVHFGPQLSESRLCDLRVVFIDFQSLLADRPSRPIYIEDHSVPLTFQVRLKPYLWPLNMKEDVEKEIQNMFDMGVIEKSTSACSSPIVLRGTKSLAF